MGRRGIAGPQLAVPLLALLLLPSPARADEIFRADSFTISGNPGFATSGFQGFDPALGTLDRVVVSVTGTLQFGFLIPPLGAITPVVDFDAAGFASGFEFAGTGARFLFPPEVNGDSVAPRPQVLSELFSFDVTFNALSDLTGIPVVHTSGAPAPLQPPPSASGRRDDFISPLGVLEQFLFTPVGFVPDFPFSGGGNILVTFEFTPPRPADIAEPDSASVLGLALMSIALVRRKLPRRGRLAITGGIR